MASERGTLPFSASYAKNTARKKGGVLTSARAPGLVSRTLDLLILEAFRTHQGGARLHRRRHGDLPLAVVGRGTIDHPGLRRDLRRQLNLGDLENRSISQALLVGVLKRPPEIGALAERLGAKAVFCDRHRAIAVAGGPRLYVVLER